MMYNPKAILSVAIILILHSIQALEDEKGLFQQKPKKFDVVYEWKTLDFNWPDQKLKEESLKNGNFVPRRIAPISIRYWKDIMYVSMTRDRPGVPVSMASFPMNSSKKTKSPILEAFPDWEMQIIGNCAAFQFIPYFEIDINGLMWVIDNGHTPVTEHTSGQENSPCSPKIFIIDLNDKYKSIIRTYEFPKGVTSAHSFLQEIVLDFSNGWFAYIPDAGVKEPGLIVYNYQENRSYKLFDKKSMVLNPKDNPVVINGIPLNVDAGHVNNIAISTSTGGDRTVYYSRMVGKNLYSIPSSVLKKPPKNGNITSFITDHGELLGSTDEIYMDNANNLYFGILEINAIGYWNPKSGSLRDKQTILYQNNKTLVYPNTFTMDNSGYLYVNAVNGVGVVTDTINTDEYNFYILKTFVGTKNYIYPPSPMIWNPFKQ